VRFALVVAAALVVASTAAAALPQTGTLVPGRSLAGVRLGETPRQVRVTLGGSYGVCTKCARPTWYFNLHAFDSHGLAVEFTQRRVSAVYTIMQPPGWLGPHNLALGAAQGEVTTAAGPVVVTTCPGYAAWVSDRAGVRTVYYLLNDILWGFGLMRANADPCR
jgi:hypothetical protein